MDATQTQKTLRIRILREYSQEILGIQFLLDFAQCYKNSSLHNLNYFYPQGYRLRVDRLGLAAVLARTWYFRHALVEQ